MDHAPVPPGKSVFYRSWNTSKSDQVVDNEPSTTAEPTRLEPMNDIERSRLAYYERIEESAQEALANALKLLDVARQAKAAAQEVAEATLAQARTEQERLDRQTKALVERRDDLRREIARLEDDLTRGEAALNDLLARQEAVREELATLERRRDDLAESLQSKLAVMSQIQDMLSGGVLSKLALSIEQETVSQPASETA